MKDTKQRSPLHLLWLDKYEKALSAMDEARKIGKGI